MEDVLGARVFAIGKAGSLCTFRFVANGWSIAPAAREVDACGGVGHHDLVHARQTWARPGARVGGNLLRSFLVKCSVPGSDGICVCEEGVQAALYVTADQS